MEQVRAFQQVIVNYRSSWEIFIETLLLREKDLDGWSMTPLRSVSLGKEWG